VSRKAEQTVVDAPDLVALGQGDESWVVLADPGGNEVCVLRGRRPGP
jgi:hypothetical protein